MGERIPTLASKAVPVRGATVGHTLITEARPETTDDSPRFDYVESDGVLVPAIVHGAVPAEGGRLRPYDHTKAGGETSDDDGPRLAPG